MPTIRGKHDGLGRDKQTSADAPIPLRSAKGEVAIEAYLAARRPSGPTPRRVAVPLLGMVCELDRLGLYFPTRRRAADVLRCSIHSIDAAISTALANEEISETYTIEEGAVRRRAGIVRHRRLIPSAELRQVWAKANGVKR